MSAMDGNNRLQAFGRMHKALPLLVMGLIAYWLGTLLSQWMAPAGNGFRHLSEPGPQTAAASVAQAHWFGEAMLQQAAAPPPIRVIGVYAPERPDIAGFAIVDQNGQSTVLLQGKSTADGWELARVTATGVVLRSAGREQFVPLQARTAAGIPQSAGAVPATPPPQLTEPGAMPLPMPSATPEATPPAVNPATLVR
jgi:hypothetical protein